MDRTKGGAPLLALDAVVIDTETTGLDPRKARVIELAAVRLSAGKLVDGVAAVGYDGWISFEDFSTDRPLDERVADNLVYVREIFGALNRTR